MFFFKHELKYAKSVLQKHFKRFPVAVYREGQSNI